MENLFNYAAVCVIRNCVTAGVHFCGKLSLRPWTDCFGGPRLYTYSHYA